MRACSLVSPRDSTFNVKYSRARTRRRRRLRVICRKTNSVGLHRVPARARAPALTRVWCACSLHCVLALFSKRPNTCAFEALRIRGARGRTRPRNCQAHRIACHPGAWCVCRRTSCNPNRDRPICHTRKRALAHSDSNSLTPERARARVHAIEMQMVPLLVVADSRKHAHMCSRMCVRTHFVYVVPSQFAYMASHCMYQLYMFFCV